MYESPHVRSQNNDEQLYKPNINDLPEEILVKIMSNLTLFHRKRMRLVCKYWNDISYDRSLIKDDWMVVPTVADMKKLEERHPAHRFINLRIRSVNHDLEESDVWEKFGPFIQKIQLCDVVNARNLVFAQIYVYCPKLKPCYFGREKSDESESESFSIAYWVSSKTSNPSANPKVTRDYFLYDVGFDALTLNPLCLTEITLRDYSSLSNTHHALISCLLTRQSKVLTHLEIYGINDDSGIEKMLDLLSCVGKQLASLTLDISENLELSEECLWKICDLFPNLDLISLSNCSFTARGVELMVFAPLKKLSRVFISDTPITDNVLKEILYLNHLIVIDLSFCKRITSDGLIAAFSRQSMPKLEALFLSALPSVSDQVIAAIAPMVPNLTHWDLSYTYTSDIQPIIHYNKGLRILSLKGCIRLKQIITDASPSINELKELRELDIDFCVSVCDKSIRHLSLKNLRILSLGFHRPNGINGNNIKHIRFSCLSEQDITKFISACPSLELVNMNLEEQPGEIIKSCLSAHVVKVLPLPCFCKFSPERHLTQQCYS